jgi:hypothetical protein
MTKCNEVLDFGNSATLPLPDGVKPGACPLSCGLSGYDIRNFELRELGALCTLPIDKLADGSD